jgi:hypothetical protein
MARKKVKNHQDFDKVLKDLFIEIFLPYISQQLGIRKENIKPIDSTIKRTQERRIDFACKVSGQEDYLIQIEFQTRNDHLMHFRMLDYYETLSRKENVPIKQLLIYVGKGKMTMQDSINHPNLKFNYTILNISNIDYHHLIDSKIPEAIILAILGDFKHENAKVVIAHILNNLRNCVAEISQLQRYFFSLEILSELRNLESETIRQIRDMPITGIDIRKTYFYQEVARLSREEGIEIIAINLLKKGMSIDFVCECTGLTPSRVKSLLNNINKD